MRKFLDDCKKEVASSKKKGLTNENTVEPFTSPLCVNLSGWFLGNEIFLFDRFLGNALGLVAKTQEADGIRFRDSKKNNNLILCNHSSAKIDNTGEKLTAYSQV